jgi:hypothetical protein
MFTGNTPFYEIFQDWTVMLKVKLETLRPTKPVPIDCNATGLNEELWELMERCWAADPSARPSLPELLEYVSHYILQDNRPDGLQSETIQKISRPTKLANKLPDAVAQLLGLPLKIALPPTSGGVATTQSRTRSKRGQGSKSELDSIRS